MKKYLFIMVLLLTACSGDAPKIVSSPDDRVIAQRVIAAIQTGDIGTMPGMHRDLAPKLPPLLPRMRRVMPSGPATRYALVGARTDTDLLTKARTSELSYEIANGGRYAYFTIGIHRDRGGARLTAVNILPLPAPLEQMNRFTLGGRTPLHYLVLLGAIASMGTIAAGLIQLVRTAGIRRKWLWAIGMCLAVGQVAINWTSGMVHFNPISLQIFGSMAVKSGMDMPWLVGFGFPAAAIYFLVRRRTLMAPGGTSPGQQ